LVKLHSHPRKAVTRLGAAISEGHRGHIIKFASRGFHDPQAVWENRSSCDDLTDVMIWMFLLKKDAASAPPNRRSAMETAK